MVYELYKKTHNGFRDDVPNKMYLKQQPDYLCMWFAVACVKLTRFECQIDLTQGSVEPAAPPEETGAEVVPEVGGFLEVVPGMGSWHSS